MARHRQGVVALVALALAAPAGAVTTRSWRVTSYRDFDEGEVTGALVSSLGEVVAGFGVKRLDLAEAQVFSSVAGPDGTVWLGTGDQAQLYQVRPGRGPEKVAKLDGVLVSALAVGRDGTIYAGTVPGEVVWQVRGGQARELCRLAGVEHIWSLHLEGSTLYAGTGPEGRVYAVDVASGKSRLVWDSDERHILALEGDGQGGLLAGSGDEAILYRVGTDGAARALHDFQGEEVRAVVRHGSAIYIAVNDFDRPGGAGAGKPQGTKIGLGAGTSGTPSRLRERKGRGAVYRIDDDGRVEQLHAVGDAYLSALHVDREGNVYAASGSGGQLYLIRPDHTVLTALNLPERQVLTLAFAGAQPILGTGDAGAVYTVDFGPAKEARYLSKVFDAGYLARWGVVRWLGNGNVNVETRAGNTARPDATWSAWQGLAKSERRGPLREGHIASPAGRYLQFRAQLNDRAATLRDLAIFYLPQNQRARVVELRVGEDPGQLVARAGRSPGKPRSPVVKVRWKVENPDDDELVYRLWYREEGSAAWRALGGPEPLGTSEWEWNTETMPDGAYVLKVSASDERSSPPEEALEHELESSPFLVDNRKPELDDLRVAYPMLTGVARDGTSPIGELAYSLDGGEWRIFAPRDAVLDEPTEEFALRLPRGLGRGAHTVAIRATDAADNIGTAQLHFEIK